MTEKIERVEEQTTTRSKTSLELLANAAPTNGLGTYGRKDKRNQGIVVLQARCESEGLRNQTEARTVTTKKADHQE